MLCALDLVSMYRLQKLHHRPRQHRLAGPRHPHEDEPVRRDRRTRTTWHRRRKAPHRGEEDRRLRKRMVQRRLLRWRFRAGQTPPTGENPVTGRVNSRLRGQRSLSQRLQDLRHELSHCVLVFLHLREISRGI